MKKHLILMIIVTIIGFFNTLEANCKRKINCITNNINYIHPQSRDTDKYLRDNIAAHKEKFINKELNVLLAELSR